MVIQKSQEKVSLLERNIKRAKGFAPPLLFHLTLQTLSLVRLYPAAAHSRRSKKYKKAFEEDNFQSLNVDDFLRRQAVYFETLYVDSATLNFAKEIRLFYA